MERLMWTVRIIVLVAVALLFARMSHASTTQDFKALAAKVGPKYNIEPRLILAIIEVESSGNPMAQGPLGEIGLMQVRPEFSPGVSFEPENNIEHGARMIAILRTQCKFQAGKTWVVCFNKGPNPVDRDATKTRYYKRIMEAYANVAK
jgi:soluble lytic murein transglycosylase-like protein